MKKFLILCVPVILSGCGAIVQYQANKEAQEHVARFKAEDNELKESCNSRLSTDPRLDPLRSHINLGSKDSTVEQLSSTKKPTSKEKQAILVWDEIETDCSNQRNGLFVKYSPPDGYVQNYRAYIATQKQNRANLWAGKITYGQYLKASQDTQLRLDKANADVRAARQQQAMQAEMQQAQINAINAQASAAVMSAQAQQQAADAQTMMMFNQARQINAPSIQQPVNTNCFRSGNQVNCMTY